MHKKQLADDIDLLELFLNFWKYKVVFASLMIVGLILGLAESSQQEIHYKTNFYIVLGHPAYNESLLMKSSELQNMLIKAIDYPDKMPSFTYIKSNITQFNVTSLNSNVQEETRKLFTKIIKKELRQQKYYAELSQKLKLTNQALLNNDYSNSNKFPDFLIAEIDLDDILSQLSFNFGPTIMTQPNYKKSGFIGMFSGLILALWWMGLSLFYQAIRKKKIA